MLHAAGYRVRRVRRANLIPKNLTGLPQAARRFYNRFSQPFIALDGWLSRVPLLNQVAGVMEIVARRSD
jgi:hypothetical protein